MRLITNLLLTEILVLASCANQTDVPFNSEEWKNWVETEETQSLRWDMRKDLIKKHKLVGLTIDEVVELLGQPERKNNEELRYFLGMARSYIDTGSLILVIKNGQVTSYRIWSG